MKLRIKFTKTGPLKYISHLDLIRTMQSSLTRAKLPLWYSEGFTPRPKLVFALPLSVGVESICEFVDIKLIAPIPHDTCDRLQQQFDKHITILQAYEPSLEFQKITLSEYDFIFDNTVEQIPAILNNSLIAEKKTKSGMKTINLHPLIHNFHLIGNTLTATLKSGSATHLSPDLLLTALRESGVSAECRIIRKKIFANEIEFE